MQKILQCISDSWVSTSYFSSVVFHKEYIKSMLLLLLSCFSRVRLCATPQTAAHQVPHPWDSPGKNTGVGCHFLLQCKNVKSENEVSQSCPNLSDPMDCSLPGSSVHGIFQARILEWGAIAFSGQECLGPTILVQLEKRNKSENTLEKDLRPVVTRKKGEK